MRRWALWLTSTARCALCGTLIPPDQVMCHKCAKL